MNLLLRWMAFTPNLPAEAPPRKPPQSSRSHSRPRECGLSDQGTSQQAMCPTSFALAGVVGCALKSNNTKAPLETQSRCVPCKLIRSDDGSAECLCITSLQLSTVQLAVNVAAALELLEVRLCSVILAGLPQRNPLRQSHNGSSAEHKRYVAHRLLHSEKSLLDRWRAASTFDLLSLYKEGAEA
jgi:hypothetical protein